MTQRLGLIAILLVMGACWGATQPLSKIAVSEGYRHLGLVFWQQVIAGAVLAAICALRRKPLPLTAAAFKVYLIIAMIGTVLPNSASYEAARHLPSGWLSICISTVPMFAFPIALVMGNDRFSWPRFAGLLLGFAGILCLFLPWQSLAAGQGSMDWALALFVPLALIAPLFYAFEGNYVARWGVAGLDPVQVLLGASLVGLVVSAPLALATGSWISPLPPWGRADAALFVSSLFHVATYTTYVWLIARAGAVFAAQVGYLVTGFGVMWAMLFLDERYGPAFYLAMALILTGVVLVQPRRSLPQGRAAVQ